MDDVSTPISPDLENAEGSKTPSGPNEKPQKPKSKKRESAAKKRASSVKATAAAKSGKKSPPPWTFPKNTLEDSIKIARAVEEQNAGNPMRPDMLAKAVGYNSTSDWRFLDLLRSANQYGLVTGSGKISPVSLTEIGQDVVAPSSPSARPKALQRAFRNVEDFKRVEEFYRGKNFRRMSFLRIPFSESSPFRASELSLSQKYLRAI
jgi:hypothetical protein